MSAGSGGGARAPRRTGGRSPGESAAPASPASGGSRAGGRAAPSKAVGPATLFTARWVVVDAGHVLPRAGLLVRAGRIERVLTSPRGAAARAARRVELGERTLTAGLVNAHAHLELSGLAGRVPAREGGHGRGRGRGSDDGFVGWVRRLVGERRDEPSAALEAAARRGADLLLAAGCTVVGDVDTTGAAERALARHPIRAVLYRELLDLFEPDRLGAALDAAARPRPRRRRLLVGLSPHAPYTASPALLRAVAHLAARGRMPVAVHWAETAAEGDWLERSAGPFAGLFAGSPRRPGLDLLEEAGLLGPATALVHGNDPRRDEPARIAAAGASVVHCPGAHAFFGRAPFPLAAYRSRGVGLALGTDSLAGNEALDPRREMALARRAFPDVEPREVWRWATEGGARALGLGGSAGVLRPGAHADLVARRTTAQGLDELWDELTAASPAVERVWIGGRAVGSMDRRPRAADPRAR